MIRAVVTLITVVALAAVTLLTVFVFGMRTKIPIVVDTVRRASRDRINPRQLESAGSPGAYAAVIEHSGRVSGRRHRTPIVAQPTDDGFVISLTYGTRADWVKNVLASGSATLIHEGRTHEIARVEMVPLSDAGDWFPARERRVLALLGIESCLRLTAGPGDGDRHRTS